MALIEIDVKSLKLLPYGFPFKMGSSLVMSEWQGNKEQAEASEEWEHPVYVDTEKYEKAILENVEQYLGKIKEVEKSSRGIYALFGDSPHGVRVLFDLRPWAIEYNIKLQHTEQGANEVQSPPTHKTVEMDLDGKIQHLVTEWKDGTYYADAQKYANLACSIRDLVKDESNYSDGYSDAIEQVIEDVKCLGMQKHNV